MAADEDSMSSRPSSSRVRLLAVDTGKNMMGAYITLVMSGNEAHLKWISGDAAGFVETVEDQMEGGT